MNPQTITVLGGGGWGSALAVHLGRRGHAVRLWMRNPELVRRMQERGDNPAYLPGVRFPASVEAHGDLQGAVDGCDLAIGAVPAQFARSVYRSLSGGLPESTPFVATAKGIEEGTLALPLEVLSEELGPGLPRAVLSGPSFAREVAQGLPTAVVIAAESPALALELQPILASREMRVYTNRDPRGVQIAGALKNVMAIAVGVSDSLGLGANAQAGLITRGLAEITRLIRAMGGDPQTASGLAGLGDLVLTCTGELSRNRRVGQRLGRGERLQDVLSGSRTVAEGVRTVRSVRDLALRHELDMPIVEEVHRILYEDGAVQESLDRLLNRRLTSEEEPAAREDS